MFFLQLSNTLILDSGGLKFLGSPTPRFLSDHINKIFSEAGLARRSSGGGAFAEKLSEHLQDHLSFTLCTFFLSWYFPSHFDFRLRECLRRIMSCSISDGAWSQATLPFWQGGFG